MTVGHISVYSRAFVDRINNTRHEERATRYVSSAALPIEMQHQLRQRIVFARNQFTHDTLQFINVKPQIIFLRDGDFFQAEP